jgi:hypothetical protein
MSNPFLEYSAKVQPWAAKKAARAAERQQSRAQQKAVTKVLQERDLLMRLWKRWRKDLVHTELDGPYQHQLQSLIKFLNAMKVLEDERKLLKFVLAGPWTGAPKELQYLVLRLISTRQASIREKAELPPFDDPLPGAPLNTYLTLRNKFMEKTHAG